MLKEVNQVFPRSSIKGLGDVQFEQQCRDLLLVISPCQIPYIQKIVLDATLLNKSTLRI
jgi:hypothetical protein